MSAHTIFSRFCGATIRCRVVVVLVALVWSRLAFGGEIHNAAANGDLEKVKALLKENPDLVFSNDNPIGWKPPLHQGGSLGRTPLDWAALYGHKDVVEFLLANKADPDTRNNIGQTPLLDAAGEGYKDVVALLLAHHADMNAKDNSGTTPLATAAFYGRKDVAELLLAHKADANTKDNGGQTPLHYAARNGFTDMVKLLLANHAEVNAQDNRNQSPLCPAAAGRPVPVAVANAEKPRSYPDVVRLLLANGADVNAKDDTGQTPLDIAAKNGLDDVAKLLKDRITFLNGQY